VNSEELKERATQFAHRCVKVAASLPATPLGRLVCGQLLRCSTSTAANYRAACLAQSRAAFIAKLSVVVEEADESYFWLRFAVDEDLVTESRVRALLQEAVELTAIFQASRKTAGRHRAPKSDL
jgi:four helix bundle protein